MLKTVLLKRENFMSSQQTALCIPLSVSTKGDRKPKNQRKPTVHRFFLIMLCRSRSSIQKQSVSPCINSNLLGPFSYDSLISVPHASLVHLHCHRGLPDRHSLSLLPPPA